MIVELISVGTEILLGDIVDTNAQYLAEKLSLYGYDLYYQTVVGDNQKRLEERLSRAVDRSDIVITTGGLGPTEDDVTREAVAAVAARPLERRQELVEGIENFFHKREFKATSNNFKQADMPENAEVIPNELGTAPGIFLSEENYTIISLPGVPQEMKNMFADFVIPHLQKLNSYSIKSRELHFTGIGESHLETRIKDILENQSNPTIALLAGQGEVKIRITAKAESEEELEKMISEVEETIRERVGKYIYGTDGESLPEVVGNMLRKKHLSISTAESCTGGLLGSRITDIPGSSDYFKGGMVVYSNEAKIGLLDVERSVIEKKGAVSRETAEEMAENVRKKFGSDLGISITGIAGPGGGTPQKPVGLVYLGLACPDKSKTRKLNLHKNRNLNKWYSTQFALNMLFEDMSQLI